MTVFLAGDARMEFGMNITCLKFLSYASPYFVAFDMLCFYDNCVAICCFLGSCVGIPRTDFFSFKLTGYVSKYRYRGVSWGTFLNHIEHKGTQRVF